MVGETALWLRVLLLLQKTQVWFLAPTQPLTTIYSYNSRESNAFFWLLRALHIPHTYTLKINLFGGRGSRQGFSVALAVLEFALYISLTLKSQDLPASASQVPELKVCATMLSCLLLAQVLQHLQLVQPDYILLSFTQAIDVSFLHQSRNKNIRPATNLQHDTILLT